MARPFKIFLVIIGALIALLAIVVVAVSLLVDPNDYRDQISLRAEQETGRRLTFGHISMGVFPWLHVKIEDLSMANAKGFGDEPFAQAHEASIRVKLVPLLTGRQLQLDTMSLDGLRLNLAVDKQGRSNWADLVEAIGKDQPVDKPDAEPESRGEARLDKFTIEGIEISDSSVTYDDRQAGERYRLDGFQLRTSEIRNDEPFDVHAKGQLHAEKQQLESRVQLSTRVIPGENADHIDLRPFKLDIDARQPDLTLTANSTMDLAVELEQRQYSARGIAMQAKASGSAVPGGTQTAQLAGEATYEAASGRLNVSDLALEIAGLRLTGTISGSGLNGDKPRLSGPVMVAPFNPRELLGRLGMPPKAPTDDKALTRASFAADYSGSFNSVSLDAITLKLDDTTASGRIAIADFAAPRIEFGLDVDRLDLDRYLPRDAQPKPAAAQPRDPSDEQRRAAREALDATVLPYASLDGLAADGKLAITQFKAYGMRFSNTALTVAAPRGAAKTVTLVGESYQGSIDASLRMKPGATPATALKSNFTNIAIGALLNDAIGEDKLRGTGKLSLDLAGQGATVGALRRSMDGQIAIELQNGAIKGFNLAEIIRRGEAALHHKPYKPSNEPRETDFSALAVSGRVHDGLLRSDDLDMRSPLFRVSGAGTLNLVDETLDYIARPTVVGSLKGQGGETLQDLQGLTLPVELSGSLHHPTYKLRIDDAVRHKAEEKLRKEVGKRLGIENDDELQDKLNDKLGNDLGGALGNLLSGKKKDKQKNDDSNGTKPAEPAPSAPPGTR